MWNRQVVACATSEVRCCSNVAEIRYQLYYRSSPRNVSWQQRAVSLVKMELESKQTKE